MTAHGFGPLLQLQLQRLVAAVGAAVFADGHVVPAEISQAGIAAECVDSLVQGQLTCGLWKIMIQEQ